VIFLATHKIKNLTDKNQKLSFAGFDLDFKPQEEKEFDENVPAEKVFLNVAIHVLRHLKGSFELTGNLPKTGEEED